MKMFVPQIVKFVIILILVCVHENESASEHSLSDEDASSHSGCRKLSTTQLDCSNLMLKELPKDIPNTISTLNFSNNQLQLDQATFASCCRNLLVLDFSNNKISNISQDTFKNLVNITTIILRNNSISEFDSETFSNLLHLEQLDLSENPLIVQKEFMRNSNLKELNIDDCNLSKIPDEAFSGIAQLQSLTLTKNPFDYNFDTSAFADLTSLTSLEIRNISRDSITELCDKLVAIDIINFDGYNFSCYIYTTAELFEKSIVENDPPIERPLAIPRTTISLTISSTLSITMSNVQSSTETLITNIQTSQLEATTPPGSVDHKTVAIDNEIIRYILFGIAATLMVILIVLLYRADICGMKGEMSRSKKNKNYRHTPVDTESPF